jgi:hypothetical protein
MVSVSPSVVELSASGTVVGAGISVVPHEIMTTASKRSVVVAKNLRSIRLNIPLISLFYNIYKFYFTKYSINAIVACATSSVCKRHHPTLILAVNQ